MGASRKLQGEIDRVLKKVQEGVDVFDSIWNKVYDTENANQKEKFEADLKKEIKKLQRYRDQIKTWIQSSEIKDKRALMDARKQIEREMERFKVCEKETKTKAFSKEGLGQQPKTDPKEKAKAETRDWLNNVVGDLESQIDNFEAEVEGLSIKKGKTRPPRLTHLEKSITRHKAHIKKLESILRLLDNDELSPEQVNDIRDFLEDYVERNQEDFDEFSDVEDLYSTLPLEKVEALEDMVSLGPSTLAKGVSPTASAVVGLKSPTASSAAQAATSSGASQATTQDQVEETASQDSNSETLALPKTPPAKTAHTFPAIPSPGPTPTVTTSSAVPSASLSATSSLPFKEEDKDGSALPPNRRPSPAIPPGVARPAASNQVPTGGPAPPTSLPPVSVGPPVPVSGGNLTQPLPSPLGNRVLLQQQQQITRNSDAGSTNDTTGTSGGTTTGTSGVVEGGPPGIGAGRMFAPSPAVSGVQWRPPQTTVAFQNQSETVRGRPEIVPDQREKFLQRLQQVQQGHPNLLNIKPSFSSQPQTNLLQQLNNPQNPSPSISAQLGLGLGVQGPDTPHKTEEQQLQSFADDPSLEPSRTLAMGDDDLKTAYSNTGSASIAEGGNNNNSNSQLTRDPDLSSGQPLQQSGLPAGPGLGVIGRRSGAELGAIGDNLSGTASNFDQIHTTQLLEAAFFRLPKPKDSERTRPYIPRHPAVTPASYPTTQAPIVSSSQLWERLSYDLLGSDALFFAFYYQQNTYQQYMAARELKKNSWRYHRKYNTWFQRHEEPKITTDEFERGSYVYFDFHCSDDGSGWCQRIKNDFTFEYSYLEDELAV